MLIDAHQHFWRVSQNGFAWPTPDLAVIHRDFGPADLAAIGAPLGLTGSVLVQSQADDRDTDWLLELAADEPLVLARHLPHLLTLARRRPDLAIVIDHGAKPPIATGEQADAWARGIEALAQFPQVFCKLSGLLTEAAPGQPTDALSPYVQRLVSAFGPDRLMWGSDWPVLELAGDYGGWRALAEALSGLTDPADLAALFGGTSRRFYRI